MDKLTKDEGEFFTRFIKAILSNPFTDEGVLLSMVIFKQQKIIRNKNIHAFKKLQPILNQHLKHLDKRGLNNLSVFDGEERRLIYFAYILETYLNFITDFDELILQQSSADNTALPFPQSKNILTHLKQRGFSNKESIRLLELFYQMRRAYIFISHGLVGKSASMTSLRKDLWNNLFTFDVFNYHKSLWDHMEDFSIFLVGETGTGKGAAARALGQSGHILFNEHKNQFKDNYNRFFVEANLSQYSESLIESEIFGHCKGAFTGALQNYKGLFSQCQLNGVLFLDEIGNLSPNIQIKLLKVLQERTFTPVGGYKTEYFQGRIIAAANTPISELRQHNKLRDDFYYRLCSDVIEIPPMRKRIAESSNELAMLVHELVTRITGMPNQEIIEIVLSTLKKDLPEDYPWPGNVRELEQAIRRIILRGKYQGDIFIDSKKDTFDLMYQQFCAGQLDLKAFSKSYCVKLYQQLGTYEAVAKKANLDRRTVKKYVTAQ